MLSRDHFIWIFSWWFTIYPSFVSFYITSKPSPGRYACSWTWYQSCVNSTHGICCRHLLLTCQYGCAYLIHAAWRGNRGLVSQTVWCLWVTVPHICRRLWLSKNVRVLADYVGCVRMNLTTLGKAAWSICVPHISHVTVWMKRWAGRGVSALHI